MAASKLAEEEHLQFIQLALAEAEKCIPTPTAFCVGCLLVARWPAETDQPVILATGYSRELPGNTHAEANALSKAMTLSQAELAAMFPSAADIDLQSIMAHVDVYTTLEPCSVRTSGLAPCADALIKANVKRCFIGVGEPDDFVKCEGAQKLKDAGIEIVWMAGLEEECLRAARRGH
ncbi:putative cytidine and deoxycytidylate deaminase zinc-binding region [Lyophyllum shimeji]|uniref:Cytidine and deoxycytidylate deaminase zinc-binding region n=1 Tax=Lyophyllum shimeji TaxID=47721 RepID=A0A9P3PF87_LYOSH|nr:putative cytidine and deoxycytidylate deaminase zinc-binding region [Lyophyllum shimeji]